MHFSAKISTSGDSHDYPAHMSTYAPTHHVAPYAERRLLDCWVNKARKKGVQPHAVVAWVRRKIGPDITTWRYTADGSIGCAIPCQQCRRELVRFGLRVTCPLMDHSWFRGFLTDADAPESCPTSGQRAQDPQGVRARRAKVTHKALDRQQRCAGTSCEV